MDGDEAGLQEREGLIDVGASFVADGQAGGAIEPDMTVLDHPAMPPEPVASLDAAPGNPWRGPARPVLLPPHSGIIGLVGVQTRSCRDPPRSGSAAGSPACSTGSRRATFWS